MNYNLTLSDILNSVDPQSMFLMIIFLVCFALIFFSLSRVFKNNNAIAGVVAFAMALGITYGINTMDIDFGSWFSSLGLSEDLTFPILSILGLILAIIIIWKFSLGTLFMSLGVFFIVMGFFAYEKTATVAIGVVLFILGLVVWIWRRKKKLGSTSNPNSGQSPQESQKNNTKKGTDILIKEAKDFKNWANKTNNPKFYGTYIWFLSYLKNRGYGANEKEICTKLFVNTNITTDIYAKYGKP